MQPLKHLRDILERVADAQHYLFAVGDLRQAVPVSSPSAFKGLLHRTVAAGVLDRLCRGIYLAPRIPYPKGLVLYHAAARLRANHFVYLSLESVLSEDGYLSQQPIDWITLMTSGRSGIIRCGDRGTIEFIHTKRTPSAAAADLTLDAAKRLWRASPRLALRDLRWVGRHLDLIDEAALDESRSEVVHREPIR